MTVPVDDYNITFPKIVTPINVPIYFVVKLLYRKCRVLTVSSFKNRVYVRRAYDQSQHFLVKLFYRKGRVLTVSRVSSFKNSVYVRRAYDESHHFLRGA